MIEGGKAQPWLEAFRRAIRREIQLVDRGAADYISHGRGALSTAVGIVV